MNDTKLIIFDFDGRVVQRRSIGRSLNNGTRVNFRFDKDYAYSNFSFPRL